MTDEKKSIGDEFADHLLQGLLRGAAKGGAAVARHVGRELTRPIARAVEGFERIASCTCSPTSHVVEGPEGEDETVVVHARGCPAR